MSAITTYRWIARRGATLVTPEVVTGNERTATTQAPSQGAGTFGGLALLQFGLARLIAALALGCAVLLARLDGWLGSFARCVEELEQAYTPMVWLVAAGAGTIALGLVSRLI